MTSEFSGPVVRLVELPYEIDDYIRDRAFETKESIHDIFQELLLLGMIISNIARK